MEAYDMPAVCSLPAVGGRILCRDKLCLYLPEIYLTDSKMKYWDEHIQITDMQFEFTIDILSNDARIPNLLYLCSIHV